MNHMPYNATDFDDDDRLPWLEAAEDYGPDDDRAALLKMIGIAVAVLAAVGLLVFAVYALRQMAERNNASGELIKAPPGDYKIPAAQADARKFQGEGDAIYATSEGVERDGKVDPNRVPEAPMKTSSGGEQVRDTAVTKPQPTVSAPVRDVSAAKPVARAPVAAKPGSLIQLGAFGDKALADQSWGRLSKRFAYLSGMSSSVEPVTVGTTTLYRLRASVTSGADANAICGKLKVAGESCMVVK